MHEDIFEPSKFDQQSQVSEHSCVLVLLPTIIYLDIKSMWPFLRRDGCFEGEDDYEKWYTQSQNHETSDQVNQKDAFDLIHG